MTRPNETEAAARESDGRKQTPIQHTTTSKDGKWRTFHKVPGLMQLVTAGTFYARVKVKGKVIRASLETDVFTTAKQRLPDKVKALRKPKAEVGTFADGRLRYEAETNQDITLKPASRAYRLRLVECLLKTWPGLDTIKADTITEDDCREWASRYADSENGYSAVVYNNSINILRRILKLAGLGQDANPAYALKRLGIPRKQLELPTADQFNEMLKEIETAGAIDEKHRADFVRFLAFSGCRLNEATQAKWGDVDWKNNELTIHCLKRRVTSNESHTRAIPLVPAMRQLLTRLYADHQPKPEDPICKVTICRKPLVRACKKVGCAPLTHHSLRHLFATFCIEAGIDIPSVSGWLGHSDGGALAMKTYGHLRREHSQRMAERVTFGAIPVPANVLELPQLTEANAQ